MSMVPIREGLFTEPLTPPEQVKLIGSKCQHCGEVSFGKRIDCPNCASGDLKIIDLSRKGKLWSYTVIRNKPPGDYKGPEPFSPFGLGLVELPEGIRVVAPIAVGIDKLKVGMDLELEIYKLYSNETGNDVMAFKFKPV
ncbi:MAG: OB-fold domain-containing protein [Chloroflexota bacterium]